MYQVLESLVQDFYTDCKIVYKKVSFLQKFELFEKCKISSHKPNIRQGQEL